MLIVNNLNVEFNKQNILKDISFHLPNNSFLNIIGPNGGGKTTLIKTLLGLNKSFSGSFNINTDNIGYMPQRLLYKNHFPITVKEVLDLENISNIKLLKDLKVDELLNKQMKNLSGGQQQRVYLARALLNDPDLIILDEAFSALDPNFKKEFFDYVINLNKKGKTIIHITHDLNNIKNIDSYILWIDKKVVFFGKYLEYIKVKDELNE